MVNLEKLINSSHEGLNFEIDQSVHIKGPHDGEIDSYSKFGQLNCDEVSFFYLDHLYALQNQYLPVAFRPSRVCFNYQLLIFFFQIIFSSFSSTSIPLCVNAPLNRVRAAKRWNFLFEAHVGIEIGTFAFEIKSSRDDEEPADLISFPFHIIIKIK